MSRIVMRQPNGLYAIFSSVVDDFVGINMTMSEIEREIRTYAGIGKLEAADIIKSADENIHRFSNALNTIRFVHGEEWARKREREALWTPTRDSRLTQVRPRTPKEQTMKTCSCNKREGFPAKARFEENGFEHIVSFMPGFVCERWLADKNDGGNHGKGCVEIIWLIRNERGAIEFILLSGWYPDWRDKRFGQGYTPMPSDLGYHSPTPRYDGQTRTTEKCAWLNDKPCYYDDSSLNAEEAFNILVRDGETALWRFLEKCHTETFIEAVAAETAIHSDPSADAWAKFFKEHFPDGQPVPGLDTMRGWFANAMMAMHDHIKQASDSVAPVMRSLPPQLTAWWEQFRPDYYSLKDHIQNPIVGLETKADRDLANYIANNLRRQ